MAVGLNDVAFAHQSAMVSMTVMSLSSHLAERRGWDDRKDDPRGSLREYSDVRGPQGLICLNLQGFRRGRDDRRRSWQARRPRAGRLRAGGLVAVSTSNLFSCGRSAWLS